MATNHSQIFAQLQAILPKARCDYSQFHVAAIVKTDRGLFGGFNIENSAYPNSICAERVAIFRALFEGATVLDEVHLLTDDSLGVANICGSCRQSLSEYAHNSTKVFVYDHMGNYQSFVFYDLLPQAFTKHFLD